MKKLLLLIPLLFVYTANSQSAWDLQQCINYAVNHNLNLRQTALNNEISNNNTNQSIASMLPSLNAGASHVYNFGKTIDRFTNTFANTQVLSQNFYVSSNVTLWSGLAQYNNVKASEYSYLSNVERLKQQQNDLSLSVANAYIGVIFSEEMLKISQNQFNITREQLERTQKLVDAGSVAKSVEYDIKAQLANEEVNVTTAENNYQLNLLSLKQLMNFDSITNFAIARPEIPAVESLLLESNINAIYETALKNQPSIKSGEYQMMSANKTLAASKGRVSPSLSFNASIGTGYSGLAKDIVDQSLSGQQQIGVTSTGVGVYTPVYSYVTRQTPFKTQFNDNINKSLGFSLSVPLFNGLQTHTAIKNAKLNTLNAKFSQDVNKQNLYKNIAQAHANAKAGLNKYSATKSSVEAATESFRYAQQKFNAGVISVFDFNSAKNRLFAAESNLLQSKYDYIFKLKVLDYYMGKPLGF
ncbi:MAG: TolC family protein [Bacteroidia bacterium]|nr:TolC family protein [Bacteroidia bacterium]